MMRNTSQCALIKDKKLFSYTLTVYKKGNNDADQDDDDSDNSFASLTITFSRWE